MRFRFLAARYETVVSLVSTGFLSSNFASAPFLQFYHNTRDALSNSPIMPKNTILIRVRYPDQDLGNDLLHEESSERQCFDVQYIDRLIVSSDLVRKVVLKKFDGNCPVPVQVSGDYFSLNGEAAAALDEESPTAADTDGYVHYVESGDLLKSKMQTLVNAVNCVGVMGKGIALAFKKKYPEMFRDYKSKCSKHEINLGSPDIYQLSSSRMILNFPTKAHWRNKSHISSIVEGLNSLLENYKVWGVQSIAFPPLGCGYGGLDWSEVRPLIDDCAHKMGIPVEIYLPHKRVTKRKRLDDVNVLPSARNSKKFKPLTANTVFARTSGAAASAPPSAKDESSRSAPPPHASTSGGDAVVEKPEDLTQVKSRSS